MDKYYNGDKLVSKKDLDGDTPAFFLVSGNRSGGKTTYFIRKLIDDFINHKKLFCVLDRFNYEIADCSQRIFDLVGPKFYPNYELTHKFGGNGHFAYLFLNGELCGYNIPLNSSNFLKKYSQVFSSIESIFMDEFQSETDHYCDNEIVKFQSIYISIARGSDKTFRYVPVYLASNNITLTNPYYDAFDIYDRLKPDTKFLRGRGWVLEQNFNPNSADALQSSPFAKAFQSSSYINYATQNIYLNDNMTFIDKPSGQMKYLANISIKGNIFSLKEILEFGYIYVSQQVDMSFPVCYSFFDCDLSTKFIKNREYFEHLRLLFNNGFFRFKNQNCKKAFFHIFSKR